MRIRWRTFWFLAGCGPLLIAIWLVWQLPGQGFFRVASVYEPVPETGMLLVSCLDGKVTETIPLTVVSTGWAVFNKLWPLILLCILAGYPLGVVSHWLCQLPGREKPPPTEVSPEKEALLARIAEQGDQLWRQELELQDLRKEIQQARKNAAIMKPAVQTVSHGTQFLEMINDALERELSKARAKIKRLEAKKRGKPAGDSPWPEDSDDI